MDDGAGFIVSIVIGLLIGVFLSALFLNEDWERAVIKRDYGLYCAQTGEFSFKGECENDVAKN